MNFIFIDFGKAFDSVEWDFLFKCLEAFNFGSDFLHWITTFYKNVQSCIMNNGTASNYFPLERDVRQGDLLSPYLFIVVVETLAIAIRQNQEIRGISIENEDSKILQYVDDTTVVLLDISSAEQLLFELLNLLRTFHVLKLTAKKTEAMWIGSTKENKAKPLGTKWPNAPVKALSVYYTYNVTVNRRDFENELMKKLNAKRFLRYIYKSERHFGAMLRHYQVEK